MIITSAATQFKFASECNIPSAFSLVDPPFLQ